jgi:hypothetical protein
MPSRLSAGFTPPVPQISEPQPKTDPLHEAAGHNYLTIGRALERLGPLEPRAELRRKPAGKSNPFACVLVLIY